MSRPTPNQMMHLKDEDGEKSRPEDVKHWILVRGGQDRRLKSPFLIKKDDPGVPSIECTIKGYSFQKTLYDTRSDVNIMAAVTYQLQHGTMPLQPIYIQLQMIFRPLTWEKTSMIHPPSLEDRSSTLSKPSSILEPEKSTCTSPLRRRRNRNQRRQILKDGWADHKGNVIRSKDIQLEQDCPETVAPSQMWREKIVIHEEEAPPEPPTTPSSESQDD